MLAALFYGLLSSQAVTLAYELGLLSQHGDPSRMALFTSKRFAKTRACHDNFQHLKGNIPSHPTSSGHPNVEVPYFFPPATELFLISRHEKALRRISGR